MKNIGNEYSWQGMLIITLLMIFGCTILYFTGLNEVNSFDSLYNYIYHNGVEAIIFSFFIFVGLYCWILFIRNRVIKPKKEILYLLDIDKNGFCTFLNRKGKKFYYNNEDYEKGNFYEVLKTHDYIHKVLNIAVENFEVPNPKDSYWLNFYSPMGNFENLFLLPIAYVIALPGILSIIMSKGYQKIFGIIFAIVPVFFIFYDLIYKIKKRKNKSVDGMEKPERILEIVFKIVPLIVVTIMNVIIIKLFFMCADNISRLILSPFCLCFMCVFGQVLSGVLENRQMEYFFKKAYIVIFLLYWFGMTGAITYNSLMEKSYGMVAFSIPFWTVGIFLVYSIFIKKK